MRFNDSELPQDEDGQDEPLPDLRRSTLWRVILGEKMRPQKLRDLCSEIVAEVPRLCTSCERWVESGTDLAGISLAGELDVEASKAGHPLLREFADCVLALTVSGYEIHRAHQNRLAGLLVNSWRAGGPKTTHPDSILRAVRITVGAMSITHWIRTSIVNREFINACEIEGSFIVDEAVKAERATILRSVSDGGMNPLLADLWIDDTLPAPKEVTARGVLISTGNLDIGRDRPYLRDLSKIIGVHVPVVEPLDLSMVEKVLLSEWPWASEAVGLIIADLAGQISARLAPILLVGPPGSGKSELVRRLGELLGVGVWIASAAVETSDAIGGTARRWASAEPAHPLQAIARFGHANPMFLVDELDKAGTGTANGRLWDALLPFLDPASAARFMDPAAMIEVDLSHVSYLATANSTASIPQVVLDRFRVFEVPGPRREHLPAILPTMLKRAAASRGLRPEWIESLDEAETAVVHSRWANGSLRSLQRLIAGILRSREKLASRH